MTSCVSEIYDMGLAYEFPRRAVISSFNKYADHFSDGKIQQCVARAAYYSRSCDVGLNIKRRAYMASSAGASLILTSSPVLAQRPHDASCLSVVSFNNTIRASLRIVFPAKKAVKNSKGGNVWPTPQLRHNYCAPCHTFSYIYSSHEQNLPCW